MTRTCRWLWFPLLVACGADPNNPGELQLKLPKGLKEISGLAELGDGTLLAVADEKAHIYRIDVAERSAKKFAKFADPVAKGDFEGIAVLGEHIYIVSSDGELWRRPVHGAPEDYVTFDTGVGDSCEVEGLAEWPGKDVLLLLCKSARKKALRGHLTIFAWSVADQRLVDELAIVRSYKDMGLPKLSPSGLTFSADRKRLFIIAAREQRFIETDLRGNLIRGARFPHPATHPQTEGVVITQANTLYLADEGGKDRGTLTRYEPSF